MARLLYIKFQDYRKPEVDIITSIYEEDGVRFVVKEASSYKAQEHLERIGEFYDRQKESYQRVGIALNRCEKQGNHLVFEYLEGKTLQDKVDDLLESGYEEEAKQVFRELFSHVKQLSIKKGFEDSSSYRQVFGDAKTADDYIIPALANIDFNLDNVMENNNSLLDYEWTFPFDIPLGYVIWRTLENYRLHNPERAEKVAAELLSEEGIPQKKAAEYQKMEDAFQQYVTDPYSLKRYTDEYSFDKRVDKGIGRYNKPVYGIPEELRWRDREIVRLEEQVQRVESDYQNSTCWKITAPIRAIGKIFGREG